MKTHYTFTLQGFWERCRQEYRYVTRRPWSLRDVGDFWDTVKEYDDVNAELYPHEKRFTNSFVLSAPLLPRTDYTLLDIQARSGKASLFWHQHGKIRSSVCVDFSDHLMSLADRRLKGSGLSYTPVKISALPLGFPDKTFDLVCSYETVEHIFEYGNFIEELSRVMTDEGTMIITCPNVAWEWVHWLTAAININHSEGPHRFLHRGDLLRCFKKNGLKIMAENTTIFLPFNNPLSIAVDQWLERTLPEIVKRSLGLRRTFVLKKYVSTSRDLNPARRSQ
ncbi:MAG: class I SAM-dependent methyltransferase [Candidatus Omnitrophica bacterium]|nr:class I SAM-dependent methyltransferase [Candidatus Omnitrophota bacterium]